MLTKKAKEEYYKKILNKELSETLVKDRPKDYEDLMELFKNHPEYPNKLKDVIDIMVVKNKRNFRCNAFYIIRKDGSVEDISYIDCIYPRKENKDFMNAMRNSIEPQIEDFRKTANKECELCKKINTEIHIDHIYMFKDLVKDFLVLVDKTEIPNEFDDHNNHTAIFKKKDIDFNNKWYMYHLNNATLRPLCKKCNLSRKKV